MFCLPYILLIELTLLAIIICLILLRIQIAKIFSERLFYMVEISVSLCFLLVIWGGALSMVWDTAFGAVIIFAAYNLLLFLLLSFLTKYFSVHNYFAR